jgi:hypothetical protein
MAVLPVQAPMFRNTGANKEPSRLSIPLGPGASFLERDFLVQGYAPAPPQINGTQLPVPTSVDATIANSGGTISAGTYYVAIGYTNANGTTQAGPSEAVTTTGTGLITVISPAQIEDATGYQLYVSAAGLPAVLYKQGTTVAFGTSATLSANPSTATPSPSTNTTGLAAPGTPSLSAGGTTGPLGASTAYVILTYVNENGETVGSVEASQALTSGQLLTITAPGVSGDATGYNVYVATVSGQEVKQNATPIAVTVNWVEPTTGFVLAGVQRAVVNQPGLINGIPAIVGMADHDYNATYGGPQGGVQPGPISDAFGRPTFNKTVFGITEQYPGIATEPANEHAIAASENQFEISLIQAWDPGLIGALVGLNIDSASNYFVADLTQTNLLARIVAPVDGPGRGAPGDTYKRIAIKFLGQYAIGA